MRARPSARPLTVPAWTVQGASCGAAHSASSAVARGCASVACAVVRGSHSTQPRARSRVAVPLSRARLCAAVTPLSLARGREWLLLRSESSARPLTDSTTDLAGRRRWLHPPSHARGRAWLLLRSESSARPLTDLSRARSCAAVTPLSLARGRAWLCLCRVRGRARQSLHSASRAVARGFASVACAVVRCSHSFCARLLGPSRFSPGRCRALAAVPPPQPRARSRVALPLSRAQSCATVPVPSESSESSHH